MDHKGNSNFPSSDSNTIIECKWCPIVILNQFLRTKIKH